MRVLMGNKFYRPFGGTERHVRELTQLLVSRGNEVVPFAMADERNWPSPYTEYFVSPIDFFDRARRPPPWAVAERVIFSREARDKIVRLSRAVQPDVAHLHNVYHHLSPSVIDGLHDQGVPVVMTLHDFKLLCPTYSLWVNDRICERCLHGRFYHCLLQRCAHGSWPGSLLNTLEAYTHRIMRIYDKIARFIAPSRFWREKHIEAGFPPERIVHIPNFVCTSAYGPRYDHDGYFVYAGRLTAIKGVARLLEAVAALRPAVPLLIAGDGPQRGELEAFAAREQLERVRFLGHLGEVELRALVAGAMFCVVPSEWYENSPYAVLESFALGTPVLATALGGLPELVEDGRDGVLVAPGDTAALVAGLERMLDARTPLGEMGRAARQKIEARHSAERYYAALADVYRQVGVAAA
jgi:glycosyltransferase involved in cell wall biosynthesis